MLSHIRFTHRLKENIMSIPFEAYQGSDPYIFVSYAHKDKDVVYKEIKRLYKEGHRIWYDEGIQPANEWPEEIAVAINNCSIFLVFISPQALDSKNVRNEINYALSRNRKFIAVYIKETALPSGLDLQMGSIQAIMKFQMTDDHYYRKVIKSIHPSLKRRDQFIPENMILKTKEKESKELEKKKQEVVKNVRKKAEEIRLKAEEKKRKRKKVEERANKIISFKGAQITQLEAEVIQKLERQIGKPINLINKIEARFGFLVENNHITKIKLCFCDLTTLPELITKLISLKVLDLRFNHLETLPESIGNLKSLQVLDLGNNHLKTLPESIRSLRSLQELWLYHNELTTLPGVITNLKTLEILDLCENRLKILSESIGKLKSLKSLQLFQNQLTTLPESIGNLSSLQILQVTNNQLTTLPESIGDLNSLQRLNLGWNKLSNLPESIVNLLNLKEFRITKNPLVKKPNSKVKSLLKQLKGNSVEIIKKH